MEKRNILITHRNCMDGTGCALAVKYYDVQNGIDNREIIYCHYTDDEIPNVFGADVIIADFSFSKNDLLLMKKLANSLIVLDHHASAKNDLEGLDFCKFDMTKSGARLTWEYLFPKEEVPDLIRYIEDRDLWKFDLPYSKEVSASLMLIDSRDSNNYNKYLYDVKNLISKGKTILEYQNASINKIVNRKHKLPRMMIGNHNVICINTTTLISEIGNALSIDEPFIAMYFDTERERVFSLRSSEVGEDVAKIATMYGGGGHKSASGFSVPLPEIKLIKKEK